MKKKDDLYTKEDTYGTIPLDGWKSLGRQP